MSARAPLWALLRSRIGPVVLGLSVGAAGLVLALWGVSLERIGAAIAQAELSWLLVIAAIFLIQQLLRAWRQALLLRTIAPTHRYRTSLSVLCVSFFLINTLPARIGELSRPLLLLERDSIPLSQGLAMVVLERAIDLLAAFAMLAAVAWLLPVPARTVVIGDQVIDWVGMGRQLAAAVLPLCIAGLLALLLAGRALLTLARRLLPWSWLQPALRFGEGFVAAVEAFRAPSTLAAVLGLTVVIWGLSGLMYPPLAAAFGVGDLIGYGEGIAILCITMLGMALPAAPGFAGTYEATFRAALALFGVSGGALDAAAVAMALTFHWWQYGVQSLTALYFLAVDRISVRSLLDQIRSTSSA